MRTGADGAEADELSDGTFVEDTAVADVAVASRPGAPTRAGEVSSCAALARFRPELERIAAPGTLMGARCRSMSIF